MNKEKYLVIALLVCIEYIPRIVSYFLEGNVKPLSIIALGINLFSTISAFLAIFLIYFDNYKIYFSSFTIINLIFLVSTIVMYITKPKNIGIKISMTIFELFWTIGKYYLISKYMFKHQITERGDLNLFKTSPPEYSEEHSFMAVQPLYSIYDEPDD